MNGPVRASAAFVLIWAAGVLLILWVWGWEVVCSAADGEPCDPASRNRPAMIALGVSRLAGPERRMSLPLERKLRRLS